ncbi:MAG: M28 family peptidase [bacterium]
MKKKLALNILAIFLSTINFSPVLSLEISIDSLKKHVYFLASDSLEGRAPGTKSSEKALNYIVEEFKQAGLKTFANNYIQEFPLPPLYGHNIIGYIEGSDSILKHEYIVLGAHYDHVGWKIVDDTVKTVYNGADDNASGTASIIEIGKALVKNKDLLKRSIIIVAFDAEEKGLLGSIYFIKHSPVDINNIKLMFSIDMVGWLNKGKTIKYKALDGLSLVEKKLRFKGEPLEFSGCGSFEGGLDFMISLDTVKGLNVKYSSSKSLWKDMTDTRPFYDEQIPCIYVSTGLNSPYHKPEDDAELINYEGLAKVSEQIYNVTIALSAKQEFEFCSTWEFVRTIKEPIKIGINAGLVSSYHSFTKGPYIAKPLLGGSGGLFTQIELLKHFALQPEILYSYFGSQSTSGDIRLHTLDLPLNVVWISDINVVERIFLYLGGYFNYTFEGYISGKKIDWENENFRRTDFGYQIGCGIETLNFQLSIKSKIGLKSFYKENDKIMGEAINNSVYITLGYYFLP